MKLCKDCIYSEDVERLDGEYIRCNCPKCPQEKNYSNGKSKPLITFCSILRSDNWLISLIMGYCGKSARFFKPKKKENKK